MNREERKKCNKPFDKRSTLSKRPSTFDRNESKSNGAAKPWSTLRDLLLKYRESGKKKVHKLIIFYYNEKNFCFEMA